MDEQPGSDAASPAQGQVDALSALAPAKINLCLHVLQRRTDGYHDLQSLVVFAGIADRLTLHIGDPLDLFVEGPTAPESGATADNLVLRAARHLGALVPGLTSGRFILEKHLPVAAGIGGGSSDAAAALRLLAAANGLAPDDPRLFEAARRTGADVPVCLQGGSCIMRGIGDTLDAPLDLPRLPAVLVNPRQPVATATVFHSLGLKPGDVHTGSAVALRTDGNFSRLIHDLRSMRNDLEAPAIAVEPVIARVLAALNALEGAALVRMSGSGATCFALFETNYAARAGAERLRDVNPGWWIEATEFGPADISVSASVRSSAGDRPT